MRTQLSSAEYAKQPLNWKVRWFALLCIKRSNGGHMGGAHGDGSLVSN